MQIKKRFVKLSLLIHPDKFRADGQDRHPDVLQANHMLSAAVEVLQDIQLKNIYDSSASAEEFHRRMLEHQRSKTQAAQKAADDAAAAEAQRAAEVAAAAAAEAKRKMEEDAAAAAAGSAAASAWFRKPKIVAEREAQRRREHKAKAGLDGNDFNAMDAAAGRREISVKMNAAKRAKARRKARLASGAPKEVIEYPDYDEQRAPRPSRDTQPRMSKRGLRHVKEEETYGAQEMGRTKDRASRIVRLETQKANRVAAQTQSRAAA